MSYFREDHPSRDDQEWHCWVDIRDNHGWLSPSKTLIPTPFLNVAVEARPS
jgi:succinate dehydrogenase/fumarate reductase flavoprotein subunit